MANWRFPKRDSGLCVEIVTFGKGEHGFGKSLNRDKGVWDDI